MPLSMTPGSSVIASPDLRCRHRLRRDLSGSALPILPQSVSRGARLSGLPDSRICYGLPSCLLPCTDQTDKLGPRELLLPGFQRIGCPPRCWDMTTTATGLLCWRDFHPLEWQLASLHQNRTCGFPAYGSYLGYPRQLCPAVCEPASVTRLCGAESGACAAGPHSPWSPPFAPPTPQ